VLEIGCGWGGFAEYAAKTYGVKITGVTISTEQLAYVQARMERAGLSDRVEVRFQDYRLIEGRYDKIVSIEMLEAVGHKFLKPYFQKVQDVLKPTGAVGLQVITCADTRYEALRDSVDWIQKHIFPGSLLPSVTALQAAVNETGDMVLSHLENLAPHYAQTLEAWRTRLNKRQSDLKALGFDSAFLRKWNYYFSYCEAAFAMRNISVLQMIYTHPNNPSF
jgi:cyclopropane-fatty-acyl-phospholipid synthase